MRQFREMMSDTLDGDTVTVNMFTGTPENCERLNEMTDLMAYLQDEHPDMVIETFIVPIPPDPVSADMMRKTLIQNVNIRFAQAFPREDELN